MTQNKLLIQIALAALWLGMAPSHSAAQEQAARKFGVYEIALTGDGATANPFDTQATVTFTPPAGEKQARTVHAFYDGGNTWRARVYVSETGRWRWSSACATDKGLDGKAGTFRALNSKLRGRLLPHPKNPRQWITEDGRWFLNLNDTAYFLLSPHDAKGQPVLEQDFRDYVRDAVAHGITSVRCFSLIGSKGYLEDSPAYVHRWRDSVFEDDDFSRLRLPHYRVADERLRWMSEQYPDVYVQFILFPRGSRWRQDDQFWVKFTPAQKERLMRYTIARYAAYPQLLWLIVNDAHYGPDYPNNNAYAREVGAYFRRHDPWQHPLSTGHARQVEYYFGDEDWSSYIHLEDSYDLGATQYAKYHRFAKPVFLGEDRYEQDRSTDRDPRDMRYFQRRLFWTWLLAGGSTNYGGRWWAVHPYSQTGQRHTPSPWADQPLYKGITHTEQLTGLDSVRHIRDYFVTRRIALSDFEPDHDLASDLDGRKQAQAPKLMRRGTSEYLIYHPNAAADGRGAKADDAKQARLRLDLRAARGRFAVEWVRAHDGVAQRGGAIEGGDYRELTSPWLGADVVLRLVKTK